MTHRGKTICVDFDGVINSYSSGWQGAALITDDPVPGAMEWLRDAVKKYHVCISSARSSESGGINAMKSYIIKHMTRQFGADEVMKVVGKIDFPTVKPPAHRSIDDRAFCFQGTFPTPQQIDSFKSWVSRKTTGEQ